MCNRYRASWAWREVTGEFSEYRLPLKFPTPDHAPNLEPRDFRPTNPAPVMRPLDAADPAAGLEMVEIRWDLVPFFHKGPVKAKKYLCTNARVETVATQPAFREPFKRRRCLAPASLFYEWTGEKGKKQMWEIRHFEQPFFCFAGLWDRAQTADGPIESFTILTTAAGPDMAAIHDRQPVILRREHWASWLNPADPIEPLVQVEPAGALMIGPAVKSAQQV
jgi:putative SOS response-associated peptidase YedK